MKGGAYQGEILMKNPVLDLVYSTHADGREKAAFMAEYIHKHGNSDIYENTHNTLEFLYKHIPLHFTYEEIVIKALLKSGTLSVDEASNMYKILEEHIELKSNFENIKEKAAKIDKDNKRQQDEFLAIVNETIYRLIKHAEFEDKYLFPVADEKTDNTLLGGIEKEMSKIVS